MNDTALQYVEAVEAGNIGTRTRLEIAVWDTTADDATPNLGAVALWYARRGVAVFPCHPGWAHVGRDARPCDCAGKAPATRHGFRDASTDDTKIIEWWQAAPDANIGAPTGRLFDVIDIDGRVGRSSIYDSNLARPAELGHALTPRTAGHHLFIEPTGRGNTTNMMPSVDYRGQGGYVLLPPSLGKDGRRYQWVRVPAFLTGEAA